MWPELEVFSQYSHRSQESDFYDEDDWRLETLGRIVEGKKWDEVDYVELLSSYDCLYVLDAEDFHKLFVCIVQWYHSGNGVEEFASLLLRRMGFFDDMGDYAEVPGILKYAQVFARKQYQKKESAKTRHSAINEIPIELRKLFHLKKELWEGIFLDRENEYLYRTFWRWYRRVAQHQF